MATQPDLDWRVHAVLGCEVTGKLYDAHDKPIDGFDEDRMMIGNLSVVCTEDGERMFAGVVASANIDKVTVASQFFGSPITLLTIGGHIRGDLEAVGLWDPASFGLHAVLYISV